MGEVNDQNDGLTVQVTFIDEYDRNLAAGEELTFGRAPDLVVDTHPSLHRKLGLIQNDGAHCWVANTGTRIPFVVQGTDSPFRSELESGDEVTIPPGRSLISFSVRIPESARFMTYEIDLEVRSPSKRPEHDAPSPVGYTTTYASENVGLTPSLRKLLTALAEPRLRMTGEPLPTTAELCARTGYAASTVEGGISAACQRLDRNGTLGLYGTSADPKRDRRAVLVKVLMHAGIITRDDLQLLDGPE